MVKYEGIKLSILYHYLKVLVCLFFSFSNLNLFQFGAEA